MAGFATVNPFVNYDTYVDMKETERQQSIEEKKYNFSGSQIKCRTCPEFCKECLDILDEERREKSISGHQAHDTLCWCCSHSTVDAECIFMSKRIPVPGWVATKHDNTYRVHSCPNFKRGRG